jgi:hypothetical protein
MTNWIMKEPRPAEAYGFLYVIINLINNMGYLGQKAFKNGSDWKTYQSSCKKLKEDIEKCGEENFWFIIIRYEASAESLSAVEYNFQVAHDVLHATFEDGTRKWYNGNIAWGSHRFYQCGQKGRVAPNKDKPCSDEQKANISAKLAGRPSPKKGIPANVTPARIAEYATRKGRPLTDKQIAMYAARRGKPNGRKGKPSEKKGRKFGPNKRKVK